MTVLDAYAVIALLRDEPAATAVQELLLTDEEAALSALGVSEVVDFLVRLAGVSEDDAALDVAQLGLADAYQGSCDEVYVLYTIAVCLLPGRRST